MGVAALEVHGFSRFVVRGDVEVVTVRRGVSPFENVHVRRSGSVAAHVVHVDGIAVTDPAWTITDLGASMTVAQITNVIFDSQLRGVVQLDRLRALVAERRCPGIARVREALTWYEAGSAGTLSELEDRFLALVEDAGVRKPLVNMHHEFGPNTFMLDFWWPELQLNVETDGGQHRRRVRNRRADAAQDAAVREHGGLVQRFTWFEVVDEPERALQWLIEHVPRVRRGLRANFASSSGT